MSEPRTRQALETALAGGAQFKYLCFWGPTPRGSGATDASCLSQWSPHGFELAGVG